MRPNREQQANLIKLGADSEEVKLASRSRKGYWHMSSNSLVQAALNNAWLQALGVPETRAKWIARHYGDGGVAA